VPRLFDHGRVVFAIPFQRDYTLIGTTDQGFSGDPAAAAPSQEEVEYRCGAINAYFRVGIAAADVVWAYAGGCALYDDGASRPVGRDYTLVLKKSFGVAPLLMVYGGKLTTFRRLAEDALARLAHFFPRSRPWTARAPPPGGNFVFDGASTLIKTTRQRRPFLAEDHARRLVAAYGTRVDSIIPSEGYPT
jgi:glycerol-3-phosphate dehydrogenase